MAFRDDMIKIISEGKLEHYGDKTNIRAALGYLKELYAASLISAEFEGNVDLKKQIDSSRATIASLGLNEMQMMDYNHMLDNLEGMCDSPDKVISFVLEGKDSAFSCGTNRKALMELCGKSLGEFTLNGQNVVDLENFDTQTLKKYMEVVGNTDALNGALSVVEAEEAYTLAENKKGVVDNDVPKIEDYIAEMDTEEFKELQSVFEERNRINGKYLEKADESIIGRAIRNIRNVFSKGKDYKMIERLNQGIEARFANPKYQKAAIAMVMLGEMRKAPADKLIEKIENPKNYPLGKAIEEGSISTFVPYGNIDFSNIPSKEEALELVGQYRKEVEDSSVAAKSHLDKLKSNETPETRAILEACPADQIKALKGYESLSQKGKNTPFSPGVALFILDSITESNPEKIKEILEGVGTIIPGEMTIKDKFSMALNMIKQTAERCVISAEKDAEKDNEI